MLLSWACRNITAAPLSASQCAAVSASTFHSLGGSRRGCFVVVHNDNDLAKVETGICDPKLPSSTNEGGQVIRLYVRPGIQDDCIHWNPFSDAYDLTSCCISKSKVLRVTLLPLGGVQNWER